MKEKTYITICLLLITIGIFLLSYNFLMIQKLAVYNYMDLKLFALQETEEKQEQTTDFEDIDVPVDVKDVISEEKHPSTGPVKQYIATLQIPAISLRLGLVSPDSPYNHVDSNITIIYPSSMPDVEKGNLIIAGHSGTGYLAFFRNLYKLELGQEASVTYQQQKYTYRLSNIYNEEKNGFVSIRRNVNKKTLTLITCTKDSDTMQTIYVFEEV